MSSTCILTSFLYYRVKHQGERIQDIFSERGRTPSRPSFQRHNHPSRRGGNEDGEEYIAYTIIIKHHASNYFEICFLLKDKHFIIIMASSSSKSAPT
mmetsp:Transcript_18326/g.26897  ORF Transcript_18326/g.26897 Transcript_18326/m.26897 type:complete len:97 (-) Transcript_18326:3183-3473(-)